MQVHRKCVLPCVTRAVRQQQKVETEDIWDKHFIIWDNYFIILKMLSVCLQLPLK